MKKRNYTILSSAIALLAIAGVTVALADSTPTITVVAQDNNNAVISSALIGASVHGVATVASSTSQLASSTPTGTVEFSVYQNTTCSGTATTQSGVALVNGIATSSATTQPSTGLSYRVQYNGQSGMYTGISSNCIPVSAISSSTSLSLTLGSTSIMAGGSTYASSSLSGVTSNAGGSAAYTSYSNNSCNANAISAGTVSVTNGIVPQSNSLVFNNVGSFYWQSIYSGDANNQAATSSCTLLSVTATSTPPTTPGNGSISGTIYKDVNKSAALDSGEQRLSGWTIHLYKGANWPDKSSPFKVAVSDANGNYSFTGLADGVYSVEEIVKNNWIQYTTDFASITISNGAVVSGYNIGNIQKNGNGNGNNNGNGHDKDKDKGPKKDKDNGHHWGWFK